MLPSRPPPPPTLLPPPPTISKTKSNLRNSSTEINAMSALSPATSLPPVLASRLQKELQALASQPPPGVTCWPASESDITILHATIVAPKGSCYEGGIFTVEVQVPLRYPFEPPKARFVTPVYDASHSVSSCCELTAQTNAMFVFAVITLTSTAKAEYALTF
jgi:hypothetical protein